MTVRENLWLKSFDGATEVNNEPIINFSRFYDDKIIKNVSR